MRKLPSRAKNNKKDRQLKTMRNVTKHSHRPDCKTAPHDTNNVRALPRRPYPDLPKTLCDEFVTIVTLGSQ